MVSRLLLVAVCIWGSVSLLVLLRDVTIDPSDGPLGEYVAPQEGVMLSRLLANAISIVNASATHGVYHRDAHPKTHGCVFSTLSIQPPAFPYNQALFNKPASYKIWIRFSSGNPLIQSDWKPDARGMAIKVLGVQDHEGHFVTQDFVMIDNPVFMLRSVEEYEQFTRYQAAAALEHKALSAFKYFLLGSDNQVTYNPFSWRLRELFLGLQILKWPPHSLLHTQFHSMTAYRLGSAGYIKFSVRPTACKARDSLFNWDYVNPFSPNALGADLANRVNSGVAYCFDFLVQPQRTDRNMPVEDATVKWNEADSPFIKVGRLDIPTQAVQVSPDSGFCENLTFSPWDSLPDFQPVGGLNRARKVMYRGISDYRHCMNGFEIGEPKQDGSMMFEPKASCSSDQD